MTWIFIPIWSPSAYSSRCMVAKSSRSVVNIDEHDHREHLLHNGLRHIDDIRVVVRTYRGYLGKDPDIVISDYGDNGFHLLVSSIPVFFLW